MKWVDGITNSMDMNVSKLWEIGKHREVWRAAVHRVAKSWTRLATEQQHRGKTEGFLCDYFLCIIMNPVELDSSSINLVSVYMYYMYRYYMPGTRV